MKGKKGDAKGCTYWEVDPGGGRTCGVAQPPVNAGGNDAGNDAANDAGNDAGNIDAADDASDATPD